MFIKVDDNVRVIAGDEKGKEGRVLRISPDGDRVVVEGVNHVWKHIRRSQQHQQGGRLKKEAPLSQSNIQIVCQACNEPARYGIQAVTTKVNGKDKIRRYRVCKKCGKPLAKSDEEIENKGKAISLS